MLRPGSPCCAGMNATPAPPRPIPPLSASALLDVLAAEALEYMESPQSSFGELFAAYLSDDVAEPDQDSTG